MNLGNLTKPKSKKRGRGGRRSGGNQARHRGTYVMQTLGPVRAPAFPKEFSFHSAHYERGLVEVTGVASNGIVVGIFEFLNRRPLYVAEYFALYKYCRITGVDIHFEVNNLDLSNQLDPGVQNPTNLNMVIGTLPFEDYSSASVRRLIESPDSVWKTVGNADGDSRSVLRRSYASQKMFGNPVFATQYWMNQTQSVLTTPQDPRVPIAICAVSQPDADLNISARYSYTVRATYHMQFFDRVLPAPSTVNLSSVIPNLVDEDMSYEEPKSIISKAKPGMKRK